MAWVIGAWFALGAGLVCLGVGLFWDRPGFRGRPQRRCRRCGYDLVGAGEVPVTCAECGREHVSERSLRRVRRHKRAVMAGMLLLVAAPVLGLVPRGLAGALLAPLPSWALVELMPLFPEEPWSIKNHPARTLTGRMLDPNRPMTHAQLAGMIEAVADGSVFAEAGSRRWGRTTGRWIGGQAFRFGSRDAGWHYPDKTPADARLEGAFDRLMRVLPEWAPATRPRWAAGQRVTIESGSEHPRWPVLGNLNERAVLRLRGRDPIVHDGFIGRFDIAPLGEAGDMIEGEIELSYFRVEVWGRGERDEPVRAQRFPIRWRVVGDMGEAVELVDDPLVDDLIVEELVPELIGQQFLHSVVNKPVWASRAMEGLGMGVRLTLFDDEAPIVEYQVRWVARNGKVRGVRKRQTSHVRYDEVDERIQDAAAADALRVRVVGDPAIGMQIIGAQRVWAGEVEVLYSDVVREPEHAEYGQDPDQGG